MSVLVNSQTKVICQGFTGAQGQGVTTCDQEGMPLSDGLKLVITMN